MKIICFLPFSDIDWGVTGSMIGGICGLAAVIVSVVIAIKQGKTNKILSDKTSTLSNNQIKISLFERRFQIYDSLKKIYDYLDNWVICKKEDNEINVALQGFCSSFGFKIEKTETATKDMLENQKRSYELSQNLKSVKFTFENREIDFIEHYFEIIFTEVYYFCKLMGSKSADYEKVVEAHNEIKKRKIIELMEKELILENLPKV